MYYTRLIIFGAVISERAGMLEGVPRGQYPSVFGPQ